MKSGPISAIGSCVALFISLVVGSIASRRVFRLPFPVADSLKVVASAGVMALVLYRLRGYTGISALAWQVGEAGRGLRIECSRAGRLQSRPRRGTGPSALARAGRSAVGA